MRVVAVVVGLTLAVSGASVPARKTLSLEQTTGVPPIVKPGMAGIAWRDSGRFTWQQREGSGDEAVVSLWQYQVATGTKTKLLDPPKPAGEKKPLSLREAAWNKAGTALLVPGERDLWLWDAGTAALRRLTHDEAKEEEPVFSPDGTRIAYVKKDDLYVLEVANGKETRLTTTGAEHVLNGKLDWVYQEELTEHRGGRAFEWSPDSRSIVYLRLDERRVPEFPIVDFSPVNGKLLPQRYPKAGDPNAIPSVHIVDVEAAGRPVDVGFTPDDLYVAPFFSWTADSKAACYLTLDRPQQTLTVRLLPRDGSPARTLLTQTDPAWINAIDPPHFLPDGSFVFLSERSGFQHLYRYAGDGTLRNAVTKGSWMVDGVPAFDDAGGWVFFLATEKDPRERQVYRARLDGSAFERISKERGVHAFALSPDGAHVTDTFSSAVSPPKTALLDADGGHVKIVDDPPNELADYALATTELGSFKGADGTLFYSRLIKPADFDPAKKYPVIVYVYGGFHVQLVQDQWPLGFFLQYLASKGFLVWSIDNRGSWGRGHAFETPLLKRTGQIELRDQLEGIAQLEKLPFVDASRIGILGWSYGGYLTLYAITHAGATFKCAAAGAPVTDWKFYDSIYTERYMKLPKDNPDGYRASSPLAAAKDVRTKLLVLHGTSDDNVHMQNSIDFFDELVKARKDFTFVPLPGQKHGPRGPALLYRNQRIAEWFEQNL